MHSTWRNLNILVSTRTCATRVRDEPDPLEGARVPMKTRHALIIYPFFPHYREAMLQELVKHSPHRYTLVGDRRSDAVASSIKPWDVPEHVPFLEARCTRVIGPLIY